MVDKPPRPSSITALIKNDDPGTIAGPAQPHGLRYHGTIPLAGLAQGLVATTLFGTTAVAIKATDANPWTIGIFRLVLASILLPLIIPRARGLFKARGRDLLWLVVIGVMFSVHWLTYFYAIKLSSAGVASVGTASYGVHVMWMGCLLSHTRLGWRDYGGLVLLGVGSTLVARLDRFDPAFVGGYLLALLSGLTLGTLPYLNQKMQHLPSTVRSFAQYLFGAVLFLPFLPLADWHLGQSDWMILLYLAVVVTVVAHSLWVKASGALPAVAATSLYYLHLVFALALSHLLLGESYTFAQLGGAALIVAGSLLGMRAARNAG